VEGEVVTLAKTFKIVRYIGVCEDHPGWAVPSSSEVDYVDRLVREHNESEHQGVESNG
jgi:hypothetical protein